MNLRRHLLETLTLLIAAILCAFGANALASRERKLAPVGSYPNALVVPNRAEAPAAASEPVAATASPITESANAAIVEFPAATTMTAPLVTTSIAPPVSPVTQTSPSAKSPAIQKPVMATQQPATTTPSRSENILGRFPPHKDKAYIEISGNDVAWLHSKGVLFLDARRSKVYEEGHIAGARSFSVWESDVDDKLKQLLDEGRDQDAPIVIYCSGGDCEDSHMLAEKLWGVFFSNVLVYKDGFPDWQKRGGAVRTGTRP